MSELTQLNAADAFGPDFNLVAFGADYANPKCYAIQNNVTVITTESLDSQPATFLVIGAEKVALATQNGGMIATIHADHDCNFDEVKVYMDGREVTVQDDLSVDTEDSTFTTINLAEEYDQDVVLEENIILLDDKKKPKDSESSCLSGRMMLVIGALVVTALTIGAYKKGLLPFGKTTV